MKSHLPCLTPIALVSFILLAPLGQVITTNDAFAQIGPIGQLNQSAVIFRNVAVDVNPGPNKPFKVNATILVSDILPRHVLLSLSVPKEISISGSSIAELGDMSSRDGERTISWTLVAAASGSFPLNITAYSSSISISNINNNFQSTSFPFDVSIGSQIVSSIRPFKILLAGAELTSSVIGPGDKNLPLNITLASDGTLPLSNVTATLELSEPFYWSYKQNSTQSVETHTEGFHSGIVASGGSMIAPYFLSVRKSATPDTYMNHLRVSFSGGKQQHQIIYDIPITVSSNIAVSIITHVTNVVPDYYTPITFDIVNKGEEPLHAIQVTSTHDIQSSSSTTTAGANPLLNPYGANPYYTIGTPSWIGDLGVGDTKSVTIEVYVPHETLTQTPLPITLTYEANGKHVTETHLIGVQIQGKPAFQIHQLRVTPSISYPGDVNIRVDVNIINSGFGIANNVSTALKLPRGFTPAFGNADLEYFGRILPNQNFTASYFLNVNTNVTSGSYPLSLLTSYYNNKYDNGRTSLPTSFLVYPKAKFDVINVADSDQLYPGATGVPLQVTLKNTGTATAQTITARFLGGNTIPGTKSATVTAVGNTEAAGNVLPGQVFTTTFLVSVYSSTAGPQTASLDISWTQSQSGPTTTQAGTIQANAFDQTVPIVYRLASGPNYLLYRDGIPWTYVAIGLILAIILVIFFMLRKRRIHSTNLYLQQAQSNMSENTPRVTDKRDADSNQAIKRK